MEIFLLFAAAAAVACILWAMEENRKWKKLALKMQDMAVKEQEKRETAEMETQWWRERAEIVKAECARLKRFETECWVMSHALDEKRRHGIWIDKPEIKSFRHTNIPVVECSECGITLCDIINNHGTMYQFCPRCGVKMDGGTDNETD